MGYEGKWECNGYSEERVGLSLGVVGGGVSVLVWFLGFCCCIADGRPEACVCNREWGITCEMLEATRHSSRCFLRILRACQPICFLMPILQLPPSADRPKTHSIPTVSASPSHHFRSLHVGSITITETFNPRCTHRSLKF